jgi:phosphatidyl-myo-inositol alpha-mannosyltransferase
MAARTPIVASDLEAFRRVLGGGAAGALVRPGDAGALADALSALLADPGRRAALVSAGEHAVAPYDWRVVVQAILRVYELAIAGAGIIPD